MLKLLSNSADETFKIGQKLGTLLQRGSLICLSGDLGAGKTAFTKGIGKGLEIEEHVTSPTYTIINEYEGRIPLYHFDVYRLESVEEMYELGYEEYFYGDGSIVVEWADNVKEIIPNERLWITILKTKDDDSREIILEPTGEIYSNIVKELENSEYISD